jgi:hypothetical protein
LVVAGKFKLYWADQSQFGAASPEEMEALKAKHKVRASLI